jgi:Thioredoxin
MKNMVLVGVLLVAAGLAAALIAVSVTGAKDTSAPNAVHGVAATEALLRGVPQRGNVLGRPDAPVTIVEYADYQCPYCARWALDTLPALVEEYVRPGKAKIVFQGIAILSEDSATALQTAVAAGAQDKLWHVSELLFHNQGSENAGWVTDDLLQEIGASVPFFQIGLTGGSMTPLQGARPPSRNSARCSTASSRDDRAAAPRYRGRPGRGRPLHRGLPHISPLRRGLPVLSRRRRWVRAGSGVGLREGRRRPRRAVLGLAAYALLLVTAFVRGPAASATGAGVALAGVVFSA